MNENKCIHRNGSFCENPKWSPMRAWVCNADCRICDEHKTEDDVKEKTDKE